MEINNCCGTTCDKAVAIEEYEKMQRERDQLAALVERLRSAGKSVFFNWNKGLHLTDAMRDLYKAFDATPAQCLAEVKAAAGRAGFLHAFMRTSEGFNGECAYEHLADNYKYCGDQTEEEIPDHVLKLADEYAASILQAAIRESAAS